MTTISGSGGGGGAAAPLMYLAKKSHCTQFLTDLVPEGTKPSALEGCSLQDFMKRERQYDFAFICAFRVSLNEKVPTTTSALLAFFVKIHDVAMKHITSKLSPAEKLAYDESLANIHSYCVGKGPNSDFKGIQELVHQILFQGIMAHISIFTEKVETMPEIVYGIDSKGLISVNKNNMELKKMLEVDDSTNQEEAMDYISTIIRPLYEVGTIGEGTFPVRIKSFYMNKNMRMTKALKLFKTYLKLINLARNAKEKIETICILSRNLMQLHPFADGNGRAVYILANALLSSQNLKPFYPENMCMFDANSVDRMTAKVLEGQERFALMFGTKEEFGENLENYLIAITNLEKLLRDRFLDNKLILETFHNRDFNLLFRQSASSKKTLEILNFLIEYQSALPLDILSEGKTSGSALDIARKNKNNEAEKLLIPFFT